MIRRFLRRGRPPRLLGNRLTSTYLKFNPLPSKQSQRPAIFTGIPRWPATDAYYQAFCGHAENSKDFKELVKSDSEYREAEVWPSSVSIGDIVEVVSRSGDIDFGIVTFSLVGSLFDMMTLDEKPKTCCVHDVAFVLKAVQNRKKTTLPSADLNNATLRQLVREAMKVAPNLRPYIDVFHAQLAVSKRVRAVEFASVARRAQALQTPSAWELPPARVTAVTLLATYFVMSYYSFNFVRFRGGPFALVNFDALDAVNKVMKTLTQQELDAGAADLRRSIRTQSLAGTTSSMSDPSSNALRTFLEHYSVWSDARLSRAAQAILVHIFPERSIEDEASVEAVLPLVVNVSIEQAILGRAGDGLREPRVHTSTSPNSEISDETESVVEGGGEVATRVGEMAVSVALPKLTLHIPYLPVRSVLGNFSTAGIRGRTTNFGNSQQRLVSSATAADGYLGLTAVVDLDTGNWHSVVARRTQPRIVDDTTPTFFGGNTMHNSVASEAKVVLGKFLSLQPRLALPEYEAKVAAEVGSEQERLCGALAGQWAADVATECNVEVPYLSARAPHTFPAEPRASIPEHVSATPVEHDAVGTAYAPVAWPRDSALALITQRQLISPKYEPPRFDSKLQQLSIAQRASEIVWPAHQLATIIESLSRRQQVLAALQVELQRADRFYIFHCLVTAPPPSQTQLVTAWCQELELEVEVVVLPHTRVWAGDQLLCTEILELDPQHGLFVLSM